MMKKLLAIFLCLFLTVSLFAVSASAEGTEEGTAVCKATLKGYQNQNGGYGVRIIAEVSNIDAYSEVGFVLSNGTKEVTRAASCVFQTLIAADDNGNQYEALTAEEGSYLYALTIMGINAEDALTLTVTPYTTSKEGVTVRGTEKTLTKPAGETFAVRHTVTYVCDDATVGTASVVHGERAALPTPPTGYHWSMANVGDVCNVTSDKTVTLTKVATSDYKLTQINLSTSNLTDEVKTKYSVTYSPSNALKDWAMVLYQTGQTVEWTTDAGGFVRLGGAVAKTGQHLTMGLFIDGNLWDTFTNDEMQAPVIYYADNIPVGVHTFRLEVLATSVDDGGTAFGEWNGLSFSFLQSEMTATVIYMNGSEVYGVETVPYGGKASAPAEPEKDGYIFDGWLLNDAYYDFGTAITGDITLTAKWVASMVEHTITFVDTEGATISTVKVLDGRDIDLDNLPSAGTDKYYAASTEDWKKCFGVTQDATITLTLYTTDDYSVGGTERWINGDAGLNSAKETFNLQFSSDWFGQASWGQSAGRYFTVSGDIGYFSFRYYLNAGASTVLKVYVDDCLVKTLSIDNSGGTSALANKTVELKQEFLAGQHTIKVEIAEGSCAFTAVNARLRPAATESTETSSAAQVQAILVDTKENGI